MDFIIEFILELVIEGGIEIGSNKKVSKWIRYPILALVIVFYLALITMLIFIGITVVKEQFITAVAFWLVALLLLIGTLYTFNKKYKELKEK